MSVIFMFFIGILYLLGVFVFLNYITALGLRLYEGFTMYQLANPEHRSWEMIIAREFKWQDLITITEGMEIVYLIVLPFMTFVLSIRYILYIRKKIKAKFIEKQLEEDKRALRESMEEKKRQEIEEAKKETAADVFKEDSFDEEDDEDILEVVQEHMEGEYEEDVHEEEEEEEEEERPLTAKEKIRQRREKLERLEEQKKERENREKERAHKRKQERKKNLRKARERKADNEDEEFELNIKGVFNNKDS